MCPCLRDALKASPLFLSPPQLANSDAKLPAKIEATVAASLVRIRPEAGASADARTFPPPCSEDARQTRSSSTPVSAVCRPSTTSLRPSVRPQHLPLSRRYAERQTARRETCIFSWRETGSVPTSDLMSSLKERTMARSRRVTGGQSILPVLR